MLIDGLKIANDIKSELEEKIKKLERELFLVVVQVGSDVATEKFVEMKRSFGAAIGVKVKVYKFADTVSENELKAHIGRLSGDKVVDGIIVQLPLPAGIDTNILLSCIPSKKDVDALSENPRVLSPVAGAVKEILKRQNISPRGTNVVIVGRGRLVGAPVAEWLKREGAEVRIVSRETKDVGALMRWADIIVSGAGVPHFILPDMVKEGVVLIDAGTSESRGKLLGDISPECSGKASVFTPVPGGVGPITVAKLFENLVVLVGLKE